MNARFTVVIATALVVGCACAQTGPFGRGEPWVRRVIDASSSGADGVKLADTNGDGLPDIVTGWEEGGITRVYRHPGFAQVREPWPAVTVGLSPDAEDAVFVDLDGDGALDVVSCCEGNTKAMFVYWAPKDPEKYLDPSAWKTELLPASKDVMRWMFCVPAQVDGKHGVDLIAAGKDEDAQVGWFETPANPRTLDEWRWHPICRAGWVMSLVTIDMDNDGDDDVLLSDRFGELQGVRWLENPGGGARQSGLWRSHWVGAQGQQVMFLTVATLAQSGQRGILVAAKERVLLWFPQPAGEESRIVFPEQTGTAKAVAAGDMDYDGRTDLVFTCEHARDVSGVLWLASSETGWMPREISGSEGAKYDLVELLDLDGDGDLDVLTCEEAEGLGVIWYENPLRQPVSEKKEQP